MILGERVLGLFFLLEEAWMFQNVIERIIIELVYIKRWKEKSKGRKI